MKTVSYYLGLALCPVLFVVIFVKTSCLAVAKCFVNALLETKEAAASHKRYFGKK